MSVGKYSAMLMLENIPEHILNSRGLVSFHMIWMLYAQTNFPALLVGWICIYSSWGGYRWSKPFDRYNTTTDEEGLLTVDYSHVVIVLCGVCKDLSSRLSELESSANQNKQTKDMYLNSNMYFSGSCTCECWWLTGSALSFATNWATLPQAEFLLCMRCYYYLTY